MQAIFRIFSLIYLDIRQPFLMVRQSHYIHMLSSNPPEQKNPQKKGLIWPHRRLELLVYCCSTGLFILYYCLIWAFNRISFYSKLYTITDFKLSQISQLKRQIQYAGNLFCFWFLLFIYLFFTVVACIEMHPFVQWRPCSLGIMWTKEHILYQIR